MKSWEIAIGFSVMPISKLAMQACVWKVYLLQFAWLAESTIKKKLLRFRVANIETMCNI
jgi:hypothetical protein